MLVFDKQSAPVCSAMFANQQLRNSICIELFRKCTYTCICNQLFTISNRCWVFCSCDSAGCWPHEPNDAEYFYGSHSAVVAFRLSCNRRAGRQLESAAFKRHPSKAQHVIQRLSIPLAFHTSSWSSVAFIASDTLR